MAEPNTVRLPCATVRDLMLDIFAQTGVSSEERSIVVETLMEASLSGYHSHGIMRIPMYVNSIRKGTMVPGARMEILRETASSLYMDANFGLGPVTATEAVRRATDKAAQTGIGCASVVRASDVARLGSYVMAPAQAGFVAVMMVNDAGGNPCVAPWGGVEAFLSTNPLAAGIPWMHEAPIIIDMSTSVAAGGKLQVLAVEDREAPEGWLIDGAGKPATDVRPALASPPRSALLPLGGLVAGHKGFALSMLVDILAGALSGAGCSAGNIREIDRNGLFVLVIDPDKFVSRARFIQLVEEYVANLKRVEKAPGVEEILIPGERAYRQRMKNQSEGMQIDLSIWQMVEAALDRLGIGFTGSSS